MNGAKRREGTHSTGPPLRVLVVDDDPDALDMLGEFLQRSGYDVRLAAEPNTGLIEVVDFQPDAVIIDIGLPMMDGYELAGRIRAFAQCALIALSGYSAETAPAATAVTSFDAHLLKPVNFDALVQTIEAVANTRE